MRWILNCTVGILLICSCGDGPPPRFSALRVKDLGVVDQSPHLRGRDGGYSVRAWERSVWFFGDTALDVPNQDGVTWLHDSFAYTENFSIVDGILELRDYNEAFGPQEPFPFTTDEAAFNQAHAGDPCAETPCGARWALWPGAAIFDSERDRVLVFYAKISAAPGSFNFESVGTSIAIWNGFDDPIHRPTFDHSTEPTLLFRAHEPRFGSAAWNDGTTLYAWACNGEGFDKPCRLARVDLSEVFERDRWAFWDGARWSPDVGRAVSVMQANDILDVQKIDGTLVAVYSAPGSRKVMMRTAEYPEGPWSAEVLLFKARAPETDETNGWIYDALPHREFSQENGFVQYVTYSRNTGFLQSELRLVRVELQE